MQSKIGRCMWRVAMQRHLPLFAPLRTNMSTTTLPKYSDPFINGKVSNYRLPQFEVEFLGSGSLSSMVRFSSSIMLHLDRGESWLFDAPDGTLRESQICTQRDFSHIRKIFVSSFANDTFLGLPNLLITRLLSPSREPKNTRSSSIEVYGPPGIIDYLQESLSWAKRGHLSVHWERLTVYEMTLEPEQVETLQQTSEYFFPWTRAYNEQLRLSSWSMNESKKSKEYLFAHKRIPVDASGYWQLFSGNNTTIVGGLVGSSHLAFGFVVKENDLHGQLDSDKLAELRGKYYIPSSMFASIKAGEAVVVNPLKGPYQETVLTPNDFGVGTLPGRKICIVNAGTDASPLAAAAKGCDMLIHPVTLVDAREAEARLRGISTARLAVNAAAHLDAQRLVITRLTFHNTDEIQEAMSWWTTRLDRVAHHLCVVNDRVVVILPPDGYSKNHIHRGMDMDFSNRTKATSSFRNVSNPIPPFAPRNNKPGRNHNSPTKAIAPEEAGSIVDDHNKPAHNHHSPTKAIAPEEAESNVDAHVSKPPHPAKKWKKSPKKTKPNVEEAK